MLCTSSLILIIFNLIGALAFLSKRYLKCETITAKTPVKDGFVLVCVSGFPLGWAKVQKGTLKNKYLPGWRMM